MRINFNKNSTGLTFGPRGAHYTINSSGRRTASFGVPGTGLWWQESNSRKSKSPKYYQPKSNENEDNAALKAKPRIFASKYEKDIFEALQDMNQSKFREIIQAYPNQELFPKFVLVTILSPHPETGSEALKLAEEVWARREELMKDDMYLKYANGIHSQMQIVPGIYYQGPYTAHLLGYLLFELYLVGEQYDKAETVLNSITPDFYTPLAKLELNFLQKKYDEVVSSTNSPSADSNEGAAREMYRAMALREKNDLLAALTLFSEIIKNRSLDKGIIMRSRYERALTYIKTGDSKKALIDFEFVVARDGDYLDVKVELAKLRKSN